MLFGDFLHAHKLVMILLRMMGFPLLNIGNKKVFYVLHGSVKCFYVLNGSVIH